MWGRAAETAEVLSKAISKRTRVKDALRLGVVARDTEGGAGRVAPAI